MVTVKVEPLLNKRMQLEQKNLVILHTLIQNFKITAYLLNISITIHIISMSAEGRHINTELAVLVSESFLK